MESLTGMAWNMHCPAGTTVVAGGADAGIAPGDDEGMVPWGSFANFPSPVPSGQWVTRFKNTSAVPSSIDANVTALCLSNELRDPFFEAVQLGQEIIQSNIHPDSVVGFEHACPASTTILSGGADLGIFPNDDEGMVPWGSFPAFHPWAPSGTWEVQYKNISGHISDIDGANTILCLGEVINKYMRFKPDRSSYQFTSDSRGCPSGYAGKFLFDARLSNRSYFSLVGLLVRTKELSNSNALPTSVGPRAGAWAIHVPRADGYVDDRLDPGEFVDVPFTICLATMRPFRFTVDVMGAAE